MKNLLRRPLKYCAHRHNKLVFLYGKICDPDGCEWADYLRLHGGFRHIGTGCSILRGTNITDPAYVSLGDNVHFSNSIILGHDGVSAMLSKAYGVTIDSVGPVQIEDNVFVGYHAIIMAGVRIGANSVIAANAVVTHDVKAGSIMGGIPARRIGNTLDLLTKLQGQTEKLPWYELLGSPRRSEDLLVRERVKHFYGEGMAAIMLQAL